MQASAREAGKTAGVFRSLPAEWSDSVSARHGSATQILIDSLLENPVIRSADAERIAQVDNTNALKAMRRLESAGIVHEVTSRKRDQVWAATAVMDELDDLNLRIGRAIRADRGQTMSA